MTPDTPTRRQGLIADIASGAVSICKGLWVTIVNFFRKKVTVNYPFVWAPEKNYKPRPGYRGDFALITDRETRQLKCTACMSCAKICPDQCIWIEAEGKGKDRRPVSFRVDVGLCQFCWLCVEVCPFDALTMTPDYEQGVDDPKKLIRTMKQLQERGKEYEHVLTVASQQPAPAPGPDAAHSAPPTADE